MTMPYLLPRRGGLFTDPPPPGGRGLALQCLLSKTPPPHLPGKAAPSTPAPEPPAKPSSELANHQRSPYLPPIPAGKGLSTGHTGRGGMLYTIPPQTPRPPDGPEGLPLRPPPLRPPAKPSSELANP
ncbi:hypothetical protein N7530_013032 [Penicillium desertorum]|uniref:Uncharacterized protein n=1 Tax=Penicillium desertorum TaxID=1303715 RepID=A0A9W9WCS5_9EURO|nr:hypothetical protein N7530_013032 [Penicillium desertorum]